MKVDLEECKEGPWPLGAWMPLAFDLPHTDPFGVALVACLVLVSAIYMDPVCFSAQSQSVTDLRFAAHHHVYEQGALDAGRQL